MSDKKLNRKLYDAVKDDDLSLVNKLLGQNADPNAPFGKNKLTCMARAAAPHRSREIENALVTAGGVPDRLSTLRIVRTVIALFVAFLHTPSSLLLV